MVSKRDNPIYQAQAILSRRDHAEAEVRQKLQRKGFSGGHIEAAIAYLKDQRLLNDVRFARSYVDNILRSKAVGPRWLKAKLRGKGIAVSTVDTILQEVFTDNYEKKIAAQAIARWQHTHPQYSFDGKRLSRFLLSRGFSPDKVSELTASTTVRRSAGWVD